MSDKFMFRPMMGIEAKIKATHEAQPVPGGIYFATDTKKIYMTDGEDLLSMGGNSGIHYGIMKCSAPDSGVTEFSFTLDDIDGNLGITDPARKKIPYVDDLIVNVPELEEGEYDSSGLYRVTSINEDMIETVRLPIAASGGGGGGTGGGGGGAGRLIIKDLDGSQVKYFLYDATEAKLRFSIMSNITEDNYVAKITYQIGSGITVEDYEGYDFGNFEFDLLPYLPKLSTSNQVTMTIRVEDAFGTLKTFYYYLNVIELSLDSNIANNILTTDNGEYVYYCTPKGGSRLKNRKIRYRFFDEEGGHIANLDQEAKVTAAGNEITNTIKFDDLGTYKMEVTYVGSIDEENTQLVYSNSLIYQFIYYGEEPVLGAYLPEKSIMQYDTVNIDYILASTQDILDYHKITLKRNNTSTVQTVQFNTVQTWSIYFDQAGIYSLTIEDSYGNKKSFNNVIVAEYEGDMPVIDPSETKLYLSANNRSNNELNKDTWTYDSYTCSFDDFIWGTVNGWMHDDEENLNALHLTSGAKLTVDNFYPYATDAMKSGQTIELDFKISGTTDFEKPLIKCLSYDNTGAIQVGFHITGQESTMNTEQIKATGGEIIDSDDSQIYNTAIQGLTAKFVEGKRIRLTWVVERNTNKYPLIITYMNGVLSGMTKYAASDKMLQNAASGKEAKIIFDSTYGDIDIYNVRVYDKPLSDKAVLDNYIATLATPDERVKKFQDNNDLLDQDNNISVNSIESGDYKLSVPYIKITGGKALSKDDDGYKLNTTDTSVQLPVAKKDYRLIESYEFIDQNGKHNKQIIKSAFKDNGYLDKGVVMYGQGTSSMEYPVKNLRFKARGRDENGDKYKFRVNKNDCPVDLVCLKADYMESSGSHNTGTGNLVYELMKQNGSDFQTPAQKHYKDIGYEVVTAIRGYPIALFYRESEEDTYEFVGKYNFNLDKGTQEPFGFFPDPEEWPEEGAPSEVPEGSFGWAKAEDTYTKEESGLVNTIHCYEFLNNASELANFLKEPGDATFYDTFYKSVIDGEDIIPNWFRSYESRYPEGEEDDGSDVDIESFYRLASWVNSCDTNSATGEDLEEEYEFTKNKETIVYTKDTKEYRLAKFEKEFEDYFNLTFTAVYYVLTDTLLMIDSRAKNMMLATWDNTHWYPIFYDMDTMLGLNNYGYNKFGYDVEDTDANIYNGQNSVLWNNFRACFQPTINAIYNQLRKTGLNYNNLLKIYNEGQADALNEISSNADARYKYVRPFTEGYINSVTGDKVWVEPGSVDYLYAAQGRRSMHREWWIDNRLNYQDGMRLSEAYQNDRFIMRLYTPEAGTITYVPVDLDENSYVVGKYYIQLVDEVTGDTSYQISNDPFDATQIYYSTGGSDKLAKSLEAVPPNNDFTLTPLHNQYISVAYGGSNGVTTNPAYGKANTPVLVKATGKYNDTETYIYGGSQLKDLGDLSPQYLGRFVFPDKTTKLETLILGNEHADYYNPNLSGLEIGSRAPYLKHLDITNCSGLGKRVLNISQCPNLEEIHAIGSGITGIELPEHGVIRELYLPDTIGSLTIIDQTSLTDEGFRIRSSTLATSNNYSKLSRINLEKVPGLNSYEIVKNGTALQTYRLIDVDWKITNSDDIDGNKILVLERMLGENATLLPDGSSTPAQSLTGSITIDCEVDSAFAIWERYQAQFPNLQFFFTDSDIIDISVKDGNGNIYWNKKGKKGSTFTAEFFTDANSGAGILTIPKKAMTASSYFTFAGWQSPVSTNSSDLELGILISYLNGNNRLDTITFEPKFQQYTREFNIKFYDEDGKTLLRETNELYGYQLTPPADIYPYKDSSALNLYDKYAFVGWYDTMGRKLDSYTVVSEMVYTAKYEIKNVYEDIIDSNYIRYSGNTLTNYTNNVDYQGKITLPLIDGANLKTDATFQQGHNNNNTTAITHIFFEKNKTPSSMEFGSYLFNHATGLKYVELPANITAINNNCFSYVQCKLGVLYIGPREWITEDQLNGMSGINIYLPNTINKIEQEAFAINKNRNNCTIQLGDINNRWTEANLRNISIDASGGTQFDKVTVYASEEIQEEVKERLRSAFEAITLEIEY